MNKRIMLVEDDAAIADLLSLYLTDYGYDVTVVENGNTATHRILSESPDALILDGLLPGKNGIDICREVREIYHAPIIMLTSLRQDTDQVVALELGADDYIVKPVAPRVLLAHLKACLRRSEWASPLETVDELKFGIFSISRATRNVMLADKRIEMTDSEFDLLWLLAENAGNIVGREQIYSSLRGLNYDGLDRSIDMRISRIRRHLDDDGTHPTRIKTVRGQGYLFSRTDWQ